MGFNHFIRTGFTVIASGIVAALADGPFIAGDAIGIVLAGSGFLIIASNWDTVAPKWNQVVQLFKREFSTATAEITKLFDNIKARASVHNTEKKKIEEMLKFADNDDNKKHHIQDPKHNWNKIIGGTINWKK